MTSLTVAPATNSKWWLTVLTIRIDFELKKVEHKKIETVKNKIKARFNS